MGPWSLGYHMLRRRAVPAACRSTTRRRRSSCLDRLKEATIEFGLAQIEAGADALTLPDHATGDLVSGEYYHRYLRDLHIEFAERLPVPIILHICGRTVDRMGYIAETGMAAFHYDSKNEPAESMEAVDGRHQPRRQHQQPRDALLARARTRSAPRCCENLDAGVQMVGPECAIPLQTPIENLRAIREAVSEWHASARPTSEVPDG